MLCALWSGSVDKIVRCDQAVQVIYYNVQGGLKGRVHGLAHAHESKCCFFARARCSEHTSNIVS